MKKNNKIASPLLGFIILFSLYHAAEYMILFRNSAVGFLIFHGIFIVAAWSIAQYQFNQSLEAWGFKMTKKVLTQVFTGVLLGVGIYLVSFLLSLWLGFEQVLTIPSLNEYIQMLGLFVFGNFFSSFSEDVLTRAYVFKHLKHRIKTVYIILISALIYVLNHIYRLTDGPETYLYLFLLGVLFMIPLIKTQQIWTTGAVHWGYNCTFYFTHELIRVKTSAALLGVNYVLSIVLILFITLLWIIPERFYKFFSVSTDIE